MSEGNPQVTPETKPAPKPRRKSVFGGLLWVILGSLLLANNLGAQFGFWEMLANWWPLVLILLGLGKLFEHYAATRSGEPPARILSGGEVFFLIVLFLVAGSIAGFVQVAGNENWDIDFPWWHSYTYTEELRQPAKPNSRIQINIPRGNVVIHPSDAGEIHVVANKSLRAASESEGQELTREYGVTIQESGGTIEIRPKVPLYTTRELPPGKPSSFRLRRRVSMDLEIHVPRQSTLDVRTERGGVVITGLTGNVTTSSRRGDVEIRDVTGNVDAELRGGDVHVMNTKGDVKITGPGGQVEVTDVSGLATVTGEFSGPIRFKNVSKEARFNSRRSDIIISALKGSLELNSSDMEVFEAGNVSINTSNYGISIENTSGRITVDNKNGDVELRFPAPPKEDVEVNNERADVEIVVPAKSEFAIDASSRNGRAESDFKEGVRVSEDDRDGRIEGKVGTRGPNFKVRTSSGTVRLRQGN